MTEVFIVAAMGGILKYLMGGLLLYSHAQRWTLASSFFKPVVPINQKLALTIIKEKVVVIIEVESYKSTNLYYTHEMTAYLLFKGTVGVNCFTHFCKVAGDECQI